MTRKSSRLTALTSATVMAITAGAAQAELQGEHVRYSMGEMEFEGYVAHNSALEQSRGTVLIVHDWDGMNAYEERRADMLAALGYTAFAIDLYGVDEDPQEVADYQRLTGALYGDRDEFRARLMAAIDAAADIPGATSQMVMIGYCFGGAAVLETARAGADLAGFVSFHGGLGLPEGQDYSQVQAPVMLFHGSADPVSGMDELAALLDDLQEAGVEHGAQIFGGALHSFTVHGSRDYDLAADQGSWQGLLSFLDNSF